MLAASCMVRLIGLLWVCLLGPLRSNGQTLYALILADTKDTFIGTGCARDIKTMQAQINAIGESLTYKVQLTILQDDRFGKAQLDDYLATLQPGPSDILLTYYTGHGYTTNKRSSNWPLLKISGAGPALALDQLHGQLRNKQARFCLTIGDCCNDIAQPRSVTVRNLVIDDKKAIATQYKALFELAKGDVLVASCSRGECSYADATEGSYYTRAFKTALDCAVHYNNMATWREVLADAQNRVMEFIGPRGRQTPIYQLNLAPVSPAAALAVMNRNTEPTSSSLAVSSQVSTPSLAIDVINRYLNDLANEQLPTATRLKQAGESGRFFDPKAQVNIYVDRTLVDVQPIQQVLERLCLNAARIRTINLIENRSQRTVDATRYAIITIQEIWEQP